ncbi:MAG: hypothetical protein HYV07_25915 [Deltaproteobacteria bacterium]|nr:hypothetical protein [Deltaproteobacteria bacterium]
MAEAGIMGRTRGPHPTLTSLPGGALLSAQALEARPEARSLGDLIAVLRNAEYWINFDLSTFEPLMSKSPSPLRELAVGIVLRFGEGIDGALSHDDLARARGALLGGLPADLEGAVKAGLDTLERAVSVREALEALKSEGFAVLRPKTTLSVHGLMSNVGRARLLLDGAPLTSTELSVELGRLVRIDALDERGRPTDRPELENELSAAILFRDEAPGSRTFVLTTPGLYRVRVPGRVEGDRRIIAS